MAEEVEEEGVVEVGEGVGVWAGAEEGELDLRDREVTVRTVRREKGRWLRVMACPIRTSVPKGTYAHIKSLYLQKCSWCLSVKGVQRESDSLLSLSFMDVLSSRLTFAISFTQLQSTSSLVRGRYFLPSCGHSHVQ